jgi:FkbM family methyltransferase
MNGDTSRDDGPAAPTARDLADLLDRDPLEWREMLDGRYRVLDEVLDGLLPAVVIPAARMGRRAASALVAKGVKVVAYGDRDPALHGSWIDGLPVLSPAEIAEAHRKDPCLVASTMHDSDITEDLLARGCEVVVPVGYLNLRMPDVFKAREYEGAWAAAASSDNRGAIEGVYALLDDEMSRRVFLGKLAFYLSLEKRRLDEIKSMSTIYFDPSVWELGEHEVIVDGGAYIGDTLDSFLRASSGRYGSYFAFEPDIANFATLSMAAATDPARITAVSAGLGRHSASARLLSTEGLDSRLLSNDEPGGLSVPIVSLDDYFEGRQQPTLIKMDIEGGEAEALLGAARLLQERSTLLAISVYHYPTDLWTLPMLMHRLVPDSHLYLRHYSREVDDTVCYAVPNDRPKI